MVAKWSTTVVAGVGMVGFWDMAKGAASLVVAVVKATEVPEGVAVVSAAPGVAIEAVVF